MPDITLIPLHVLKEYRPNKIGAMLHWLDHLHTNGKTVPYGCRWWLDDFSPHWARSHTFRHCMNYFIRIVEN